MEHNIKIPSEQKRKSKFLGISNGKQNLDYIVQANVNFINKAKSSCMLVSGSQHGYLCLAACLSTYPPSDVSLCMSLIQNPCFASASLRTLSFIHRLVHPRNKQKIREKWCGCECVRKFRNNGEFISMGQKCSFK